MVESHGFVYWSDGGKLKRATLEGSNETVIIDTGKLNVIFFIISCRNGLMKAKRIANLIVNTKLYSIKHYLMAFYK